jgi:putative transposase
MQRTNTFIPNPTVEQERILRDKTTNCAKLWNEATYRKRQAYMNYQPLDWECKDLYQKYSPLIDSSTTQQIIRKSNESWRSFFALKQLEREGRLPLNIEKVCMPGYWKRNGKYRLMVVLRKDCYSVKEGVMKLPKGLRIPFKGKPRWTGKQGRAEVIYDDLDGKWRVFQAVKVKSLFKPRGSKTCYIDIGIINLFTVWLEGWRQPIAFSGRNLLSDWWYWNGRIAECQSILETINGKKSSMRLSRLYRIRQRRFRQAINTMIRSMVIDLYDLGVSKIVIGNLTGIREGNDQGKKSNSMIHNFWSFNYIIQRLKCTAQEYGIRVKEVNEYKTSSICIRCDSENIERKGRLFKCLECGLEENRDAIGVLNMANLQYEGTAIRVMTHPKLLKWDGMRWQPRRAVTHRPMNTPEARIPRLKPWKCQYM